MADHLSEAEAIRELARHTEAVNYVFKNLPFRTISILSLEAFYRKRTCIMLVFFANEMVQTKCTKIHITPNEVFHWELGGDTIQTFDTDCGKIGIVICYDVEFPEL
jgi:predicted amidohydrolase